MFLCMFVVSLCVQHVQLILSCLNIINKRRTKTTHMRIGEHPKAVRVCVHL